MQRILIMSLGLAAACVLGRASADESPAKAPAAPAKPPSWEMPYRLTKTEHIAVRVKINGSGPYNLIVDSGAPVLIVSTAVCAKVGVKADEKKWGVCDTFEIEGGPKLTKPRVRVEDMFQADGMNALGLVEVKLDGVIGYELLSRYRLEFDFTGDTMTWTELDYKPAPPKGKGNRNGDAEAMGKMMGGLTGMMGALMGKKGDRKGPVRRGYVGIELGDTDAGVVATRVLPKGPAAAAGVRDGDRITRAGGQNVKTIADVLTATAAVPVGQPIELTVIRDESEKNLTITTGEGL